MTRRTAQLIKVVVSVGLLAVLIVQIGPGRLVDVFRRSHLSFVLLAALVVCLDALVRAFNWSRVLAARGDELPLADVFRAFAVGGFLGAFVPSSLGVDAGRTVVLARREEITVSRSASSLVMLNLTGFWALGVLFLMGLGGLAVISEVPASLKVIGWVAGAGTAIVPALLWTKAAAPASWHDKPLLGRIARFLDALAAFRSVRRRLAPVFLIALLNQLFAVTTFYLLFRASGVQINPAWFPLLVPAVTLARLIPASVAGFGAEQAAVVIVFGWAGVAASRSMAASLLASLLGGLFIIGCGLYFTSANLRELLARSPGDDADMADGVGRHEGGDR